MSNVCVFICDEKVKIGVSVDVESRAKQISSHFANVEIYRVYPNKDKAYEHELHVLFSKYYLHNEYFSKDVLPMLPEPDINEESDYNEFEVEIPIDITKIPNKQLREFMKKVNPIYLMSVGFDENDNMVLIEDYQRWGYDKKSLSEKEKIFLSNYSL